MATQSVDLEAKPTAHGDSTSNLAKDKLTSAQSGMGARGTKRSNSGANSSDESIEDDDCSHSVLPKKRLKLASRSASPSSCAADSSAGYKRSATLPKKATELVTDDPNHASISDSPSDGERRLTADSCETGKQDHMGDKSRVSPSVTSPSQSKLAKGHESCSTDEPLVAGKTKEWQLPSSPKGEGHESLDIADQKSDVADTCAELGNKSSLLLDLAEGKTKEEEKCSSSGDGINTLSSSLKYKEDTQDGNTEIIENPRSVGSDSSHSRRESVDSVDSLKMTSDGAHHSKTGRSRGRKFGRRKSATGKKLTARRRSSSTEQSQQDEGDTEHLKAKKVPNRPGISFEVGAYVEAKDYWEKWYPSKIIDVDLDESEVLIHFVKWSHRFDEWMPMDSPRLRPITHPATRNDIKGKLKTFKIGEKVNARWTDCKMYPGKIVENNPDGTYTVMFYDGYRRRVQAINIQRGKAGDGIQGNTTSPGRMTTDTENESDDGGPQPELSPLASPDKNPPNCHGTLDFQRAFEIWTHTCDTRILVNDP